MKRRLRWLFNGLADDVGVSLRGDVRAGEKGGDMRRLLESVFNLSAALSALSFVAASGLFLRSLVTDRYWRLLHQFRPNVFWETVLESPSPVLLLLSFLCSG